MIDTVTSGLLICIPILVGLCTILRLIADIEHSASTKRYEAEKELKKHETIGIGDDGRV
jgi:hypothetical protein